jgi:hypothetical protein
MQGLTAMNQIPTRTALLVTSILLVSVFGCRKPAERTEPSLNPVPDASQGSEKKLEFRLPDKSLSVAEYVRLGMPSPDKVWSESEMRSAKKVIDSLATENPSQLPRYDSERSGSVFARITARDNSEIYRDRSIPIQTRLSRFGDYREDLSSIWKKYTFALGGSHVDDIDHVELTGAVLRAIVLGDDQADEFLATFEKTDPTYPVRLDGLTKMRRSYGTILNGALVMLASTDKCRPFASARLLSHLQESAPVLLSRLAPEIRSQLIDRLKRIQSDPSRKELHPEIDDFLNKIAP